MKFNIRTMMFAIAAIAVVLVSVRSDILFRALVLGSFVVCCAALARGVWLWACPFRRVSSIGFVVSAIFTNAFCLMASLAFSLLPGKLIVAAVCVFGIPVVFGFGAASSSAATSENATSKRPQILAWALTVGLSIAPLTMLFTIWPFRLAFAASRPALDKLADQVARGERLNTPRWVGAFRIVGSVVDPATGTVGLIIDPNPNGRSGFARETPGTVGRLPFYNLGYDLQLSEKWRYVEED